MDKIDEFVKHFNSKSTRDSYRSILKSYFRVLNVNEKDYFSSKRNYENDVITYWQSIMDCPPKSIASRMACIKSFLIENDIEIKEKIWRNIKRRTKGGRR